MSAEKLSGPHGINQQSENQPENPSRRNFLVGALSLAIAARSTPEFVKILENLGQKKELPPYMQYDGFLEAWMHHAATISIHEADEDPEASELVLNYPNVYIPELNASNYYGHLFSIHNDYDVDYMNDSEREWRSLETATQRYVDAGVQTIEFDEKINPNDTEGIALFKNFIRSLSGSGIRIIVSGSYKPVLDLAMQDDELSSSIEALPTIDYRYQFEDYEERMKNDELPPNIGATARFGSKYYEKILRINSPDSFPLHPTKIWDVQDEQEAASLMRKGATIIGTDKIRFHDRALQLTQL